MRSNRTKHLKTYMSDNINQWHSSAGGAVSRCGNSASATARLRGNRRYLDAASKISAACIKNKVSPQALIKVTLLKQQSNQHLMPLHQQIATSFFLALHFYWESVGWSSYLIGVYVFQAISVPESSQKSYITKWKLKVKVKRD